MATKWTRASSKSQQWHNKEFCIVLPSIVKWTVNDYRAISRWIVLKKKTDSTTKTNARLITHTWMTWEMFGMSSPRDAASVQTSTPLSRKCCKFFALSSIGVSRWYKTHGISICCNMSKTELEASTVFVNTIVRFGEMSESWIPLFRPYFTASRRASTCVSAVTSIHLRSNQNTWCTIIKCSESMVGIFRAHSFRLCRVWERVMLDYSIRDPLFHSISAEFYGWISRWGFSNMVSESRSWVQFPLATYFLPLCVIIPTLTLLFAEYAYMARARSHNSHTWERILDYSMVPEPRS
jgi:hypothetical protein